MKNGLARIVIQQQKKDAENVENITGAIEMEDHIIAEDLETLMWMETGLPSLRIRPKF